MCGLLAKCVALIVMIHAFRAISRWAGPRWSGLALGLPSTTAIVLLLCGFEHGRAAATVMAESSLLGLVAAVAMPLCYGQAVWLGWWLPPALLAAVGGYLAVASGMGYLAPLGVIPRITIATAAILAASCVASRLPACRQNVRPLSASRYRRIVLRSVIPALYILVVAVVDALAGPSWTGLVGTFPSMSLVVLAVTHLEAGPAEASRIARVLPAGNLSTLAFLAAFRGCCPALGLAGGMLGGYASALLTLSLVAGGARRAPSWRPGPAVRTSLPRSTGGASWGFAPQTGLPGVRIYAHARLAPHRAGRKRLYLPHRAAFSPLVETLAW